MNKTISSLLLSIVFISMVVVGCSGGKGNPIIPEKEVGQLDSLPIINLTDAGDASNALGILGAYELTINPEKMSAELISMRTPTVGESFIVSGIAFFTITPCVDCLEITGIGYDMGNVELKFRIKHPFEPGVLSDPPSASNRRDLDVFDLAIVIKAENVPTTNYPLMGISAYTNLVANANGYTRELSNVISNQLALPYVLVIDDSIGGTSTWNKFAMGASEEFDVDFIVTLGIPLHFDMYLTMGYGASAKKADRLNPKYYNPEFNRKAAWKVLANPLGMWVDNDAVMPVNVEARVFDWQIGATVYATPDDFANAPSDNIYALSNVESVSVEIPGMNDTLPSVTTPVTGIGSPSAPFIFHVPVANENLLAAGQYIGIVKVKDTRPVLTVADGRDIIIDTPDGIDLNRYEMPEYATYQTFKATVMEGCEGLCWAKSAGGEMIDRSYGITTLSDNSTVVTGQFDGDATFGEGEPNETTLICYNLSFSDIFIARYNPDGTLMWAKRAGSTGQDISLAIAAFSDNSTVITGVFEGSATFGEDETNETILTSSGDMDIFIAKYDPNGSLVWAKRAGGTWVDSGFGITTLSTGSSIITGRFRYMATFGEEELNETILTSLGLEDIFIANYNPDGTLSRAKRVGITEENAGYALTTLSDNSVAITGKFVGSPVFGQGESTETTLNSAGEDDIFIARYNSNLTLVWAKRAGGINSEYAYGITNLIDNSTVISGTFEGPTTFGPGEAGQTILTSSGGYDIFIARYNSNGTLAWAKGVGDTMQDDRSISVTTLSGDTTVMTGSFHNSVIFGESEPNETTLTSSGSSETFIAAYNPDGTLAWAKSEGGPSIDEGLGITSLTDDSIVVTGEYWVSSTFGDGEPNETTLYTAGAIDVFVARFLY